MISSLRIALAVVLAASLGRGVAAQSAIGAPNGADPLGPIVAEALRNNLGLAEESLAVVRAEAGLRDARGRFFPSLSLDGRYSQLSGALNLGDFVNPAYAALNQVIGSNRFPTDLDVTIPFQYESRVRLIQPLFNASILANHSLAKHTRDGQRLQHGAAARSLAARAQSAFLEVGAARSARRTWESTLALVTESERVAQRLVDAGAPLPTRCSAPGPTGATSSRISTRHARPRAPRRARSTRSSTARSTTRWTSCPIRCSGSRSR